MKPSTRSSRPRHCKRQPSPAVAEPMERRVLLSIDPAGPTFPIFTGTTARSGGTSANNLAVDAAGNFVAVYWAGNNLGGALYARRFNVDGTPRGPAVVVAENASGSSVALRPDGGYVVTWGFGQAWARVFNGSDQPLTDAFEVAPRMYSSDPTFPNVATDAKGNFVVAWDDVPEPGERAQVFARRFDATGEPLGDPFFVTSALAGGQGRSTAGMAPDGHFAVAWDNRSLPQGEFVFGRFGDPEGNPTGDDFPLAEEGLGTMQSGVDVAVAANGNFLFVWQEHPLGSWPGQFTPWELQGRWFDSSGAPLGPDMTLRPGSTEFGPEFGPFDIATDAAGDSFVVAWEKPFFARTNPLQVVAQVFDSDGDADGPAFQVSPAPGMGQTTPAVGMDADGDFVVAWNEGKLGEGVNPISVLARRFTLTRPVPPAVAQVYVGGSSWAAGFRQSLAGASEYGFGVPASDQSNELPWTNLDQVSIAFTEDVRVDAADLVVSGINVSSYEFDANIFTYDTDTMTATWRLPQGRTFENDRITLHLKVDGPGGVTSADGLALDGDWTNPAGAAAGADAYPSGNGTAGGDFRFRLNVLPGDATRGGAVNALDRAEVKRRLNSSTSTTGGAGYSPFVDVTGDGRIDALDSSSVKQWLNRSLPASQALFAIPPQSTSRNDEGERRESLLDVLSA